MTDALRRQAARSYNPKAMFADDTLFRLADDAVATTVEGEAVILDVTSGTYFGLEGVGAFVCERLQEPVTFAHLVDAVVDRYDVERERSAADLQALMADLQSAGLITTGRPVA